MKAKSNLSKRAKAKKVEQAPPDNAQRNPLYHIEDFFPDKPLLPVDVTKCPKITKKELFRFDHAAYIYRIAKADFERKRAEIVYKLAMGCTPENSAEMSVMLDKDDRLVTTISEDQPTIVYRS